MSTMYGYCSGLAGTPPQGLTGLFRAVLVLNKGLFILVDVPHCSPEQNIS